MTNRKKLFGDDGFTKVSVLLGVKLAVACLWLFDMTPKLMRSAAPVPVSDQALQEALVDSLSRLMRTKVVHGSVPCADPEGYFQSHSFLKTYTANISEMKANPPAGLSNKAWNDLFQGSMASNSFAGAALSRCALQVLGTGGRFHFCLQVERDLQAPRESFLRTPLIFAEVSIQLRDFRSGKGLTCAQYLEPTRSTAGARVEYLLFSINEKGEQLEVVKRRSAFTLSR
jgi:hypothetical protein